MSMYDDKMIDDANEAQALRVENARLQEQVERYNHRIIELLEETLELRALAKVRGEVLRRFLNLHPFASEVGVCISCGGKAKDYPDQIHFDNCLWVQIGNSDIITMTPEEALARGKKA